MKICLIWAQSSNGYIGKNGQLLFQIPEDMKRFKDHTNGHYVIMGRKTWDSLPPKFQPLPNRINMVLSSSIDNVKVQRPDDDDAPIIGSTLGSLIATAHLDDAKKMVRGGRDIWIIGGESVYQEGLQFADEIYVTNIIQSFMGDAKAPTIPEDIFARCSVTSLSQHEGLSYQFIRYQRKHPKGPHHGNE